MTHIMGERFLKDQICVNVGVRYPVKSDGEYASMRNKYFFANFVQNQRI